MKLQPLKEIIEERKGKAIEKLSTSYANDSLPLEEYERLVEYINKIESERELMVVEKIVAEYGESETPERAFYDDDKDEQDYNRNNLSSPAGSNLTILSTRTFSGPLKSGSQFVSILGSGYITVRKSDLSKKRTVLYIVTILGDSVIAVESGIRVINRAIPILGNVEMDHNLDKKAGNGEPELVISGTALLGNITIKSLKQ